MQFPLGARIKNINPAVKDLFQLPFEELIEDQPLDVAGWKLLLLVPRMVLGPLQCSGKLLNPSTRNVLSFNVSN